MKTIFFLLLVLIVASGMWYMPVAQAAPVIVDEIADSTGTSLFLPLLSKGITVDCQFGIASGPYSGSVDINALVRKVKAGNFINWGKVRPAFLSMDTEYTSVLYIGPFPYNKEGIPDRYPATLQWVETNISKYPGGVWLIGNEPDTVFSVQDGMAAEEYGKRYFTIATRIRQLNPTAKIGFGNLVQPSPLRLRYLEKAWNELVRQAGSQEAASKLIDIWAMHAFILNETPGEWGTGVPPGFENDAWDAHKIKLSELSLTHSNQIFEERMRAMRKFMLRIGERNKPLWVTEFGSLIPPNNGTLSVSEENTAKFMTGTFDFMRSASDPSTGYPLESNHLVQRWFWYSLVGRASEFGGMLFDPDKNFEATYVGKAYMDYVANMPLNSECNP